MTFLVVADFILNAKYLDNNRLGKQRIEATQILDALRTRNGGWANHVCTLSWMGYEKALMYYINCIVAEWVERGFDNTIPTHEISGTVLMPWWVDWNRLHQSHRAMLVRKNPFHYKCICHDDYSQGKDPFEFVGLFNVEKQYRKYGYIWPVRLTYDRKNEPIEDLADDVPEHLINPVYCSARIKSGKRKGEYCHNVIKDLHPCGLCNSHRRGVIKPVTCIAILQSGERMGNPCGCKVRDGNESNMCKKHRPKY